MSASYLPGDLATRVGEDGVVVAPADRLAEVAALGERDLDARTVADVLSRGIATDLPDFAAVLRVGDEVRVAVRGAFVVRVDGFAVDGTATATWAEASAALADDVVVEVLPAGTTPTGPALPLTGGVVRSGGVTWRPGARTAPVPPAAPAPAPAAPVDEYTVVRRSPASAAAPPAPASPTPPLPPAPPLPPPPPSVPVPPTPPAPAPLPDPSSDPSVEHDGRTITPAQLQALRAGQAPVAAPPAPPAPPAPAPPAPPPVGIQPLRPLVALQLSSGRVVQVRRRVLIGRSPRVQQVGGSANLPALVTVDDPYVSSTHLEVAFDGVRVTVIDTSTNGTLLAHQGRAPFPLDHGVPTEIAVGDVLTLSKGLTATVVPAPDQV